MTEDLTTTSFSPNLQESVNLGQIGIGLFSGSIAGACNVLVGHPFDTTKVRMQVSGQRLWTTLSTMIKNEGYQALYKGVRPTFFNIPFIYASYFAAYEAGKWMQGIPLNSKEPITLKQSIIAGAFSGLPVCLLLTPTELIKCRLQVEGMHHHQAGQSTQPWQLVRQIVAKDGVSGLYRGNLITVAREIPSGAAIYVAYDLSKNFFDSHLGPLVMTPLICGAIGGVATTLASYPQDIIKTNIQVADAGKHQLSVGQVAQSIFHREGLRGFWRGFLPSATRAVLVESITFLVYDFCKNLFDRS